MVAGLYTVTQLLVPRPGYAAVNVTDEHVSVSVSVGCNRQQVC